MSTVKLVVIGASGVGKTSLRGQYISGRFSNGYRATIGADFIAKTLPHPSKPSESVTLQIWDTAGQERFSSLSSAFFRGADAAILMFDVNMPHTMEVLTKWWAEFRHNAPLAEEDMEDFCCVVVGNKMDLVNEGGSGDGNEPVTEAEASDFLQELVPHTPRTPSPIFDFPVADSAEDLQDSEHDEQDNPLASSQLTVRQPTHVDTSSPPQMRSNSIAIIPNLDPSSSQSHSPKHHLSKSRSRSPSHFYGGTMTTSHTTLTVYHTPSSSVFDVYQSARSSPELWSTATSAFSSPGTSPSSRTRRRTTTSASTRSESTGSAVTITPSLFAREHSAGTETRLTTPDDRNPFSIAPLPPPPERGPKLFFTSAKTGEGVSAVFEYIAGRVVRRWEYEERLEARQLHMREASAVEPIRLGFSQGVRGRQRNLWSGACCG